MVIGKGGQNVKQLRDESKAVVMISELVRAVRERVVSIKGTLDQANRAVELILSQLQLEEGADGSQMISVSILVPNVNVGRIIGKSGAQVKQLQQDTGSKITIAGEMIEGSTERRVTVSGARDSCVTACQRLVALLFEHAHRVRDMLYYQPRAPQAVMPSPGAFFSPYAFPHAQSQAPVQHAHAFPAHTPAVMPHMSASASGASADNQVSVTITVTVPNASIGCILGERGSIIREIRRQSGANIKVSETANENNERTITISGTSAQNEFALYLITHTLNLDPNYQRHQQQQAQTHMQGQRYHH
eukprot:TRINITY_DN432_c0_g1_i2.p1 TRINITY_DN432_c0_g1~~TRINITY_DN432_c0_g1_i2.p1  ORF type:complete len:303 (+),score=133.78 TRINITY_DN432_c0_g1_i2:117-1025(+)